MTTQTSSEAARNAAPTKCRSTCFETDSAAGVPAAGAPRASRSSLLVDQTQIGDRRFCSWHDAGWRSLIVRDMTAHRAVHDVPVPAIDDQLLVLVMGGARVFESRQGTHWRRAQFTPGRITMTAPGRGRVVRWRTTSEPRQRALQVYLPGRLMKETAERVWGRDDLDVSMPDTLSTEDIVLETVLRDALTAARASMDDLYAEAAANFLAVHLISRHTNAGSPRDAVSDDRRVAQAVEFLHDNMHAEISVADVAQAVSLSSYHLIRIFGAAMGAPPHRYLTRLRVDRARGYLRDSQLSLPEIAARCGFTSPAQLRAAFVRELGMAPTNFRASSRRSTLREPGDLKAR